MVKVVIFSESFQLNHVKVKALSFAFSYFTTFPCDHLCMALNSPISLSELIQDNDTEFGSHHRQGVTFHPQHSDHCSLFERPERSEPDRSGCFHCCARLRPLFWNTC